MKTSLVLFLALGCVVPTVRVHAQDATPAGSASLPEGLRVVRFELATGVEAREPVGAATQFPFGTKVYLFLELANAGGEEELLVHIERDGGKAQPPVSLKVPVMKRYRTYSFAQPRAAGHYRAVVTTRDGQVVAEKAFDVTAS